MKKRYSGHRSWQNYGRQMFSLVRASLPRKFVRNWKSVQQSYYRWCQRYGGMSTDQIAFATGRTKRLIKEYEQIIEEYKNGSYNMKQLLGSEANIENNIESSVLEYAEKME